MLHASTGSGSAAAPVSEPPAPAAAATAKRRPRPRSARRSISPLRATSGTNGPIPSLLIVMFSSLEAGQPPEPLQVIEFHASAYHVRCALSWPLRSFSIGEIERSSYH